MLHALYERAELMRMAAELASCYLRRTRHATWPGTAGSGNGHPVPRTLGRSKTWRRL